MKTSITTTKGTPGAPTPLNTAGRVFESSSGRTLPSHQQDTTQTEVSRIILDVRQALPLNELTGAKEQAQEFQVRMELFVQEVERVRKGLGYEYDSEDYAKRLSMSSEVVTEIFERILSENEGLSKAYEVVMGGFSGDREQLKERIMKEYGEDLVYEGMKEEIHDRILFQYDCYGHTADEIKEMVINSPKDGGGSCCLWNEYLGDIFPGKAKLFFEMVVGFAKNGGKFIDLSKNSLNQVFIGNAHLFLQMVVEFAKNGGRGLALGNTELELIFEDEGILFGDMITQYARNGGKYLDISWDLLDSIYGGNPHILSGIIQQFARNGGRLLNLKGNGQLGVFMQKPELYSDTIIGYARNGGKNLNIEHNEVSDIYKGKMELLQNTITEYMQAGGGRLILGCNGIDMRLIKIADSIYTAEGDQIFCKKRRD